MVKVIEPAAGKDTSKRDQFLHDMGMVIALWSQFEMAIEVAASRILKFDPADCSLIFSSIQFKAKESIICSLLERDGKKQIAKQIEDIVKFAERNVLLHAPLGSEHDFSKFSFWKRTTARKHNITRKDYTADSFHRHLGKLHEKVNSLFIALEISEADLSVYGRAAGFEGIDL